MMCSAASQLIKLSHSHLTHQGRGGGGYGLNYAVLSSHKLPFPQRGLCHLRRCIQGSGGGGYRDSPIIGPPFDVASHSPASGETMREGTCGISANRAWAPEARPAGPAWPQPAQQGMRGGAGGTGIFWVWACHSCFKHTLTNPRPQ